MGAGTTARRNGTPVLAGGWGWHGASGPGRGRRTCEASSTPESAVTKKLWLRTDLAIDAGQVSRSKRARPDIDDRAVLFVQCCIFFLRFGAHKVQWIFREPGRA